MEPEWLSEPRPNTRLQRTPSAPLSRKPLGTFTLEGVKMETRLGMNRVALMVVIIGLLCFSADALGEKSQASDRGADRERILSILARWEEAWNRHDMKAFASLFHEDGVWVLWTGDVWEGRNVIEQGHAAVHKTVFRNSIQRERLEELRFTGAGGA